MTKDQKDIISLTLDYLYTVINHECSDEDLSGTALKNELRLECALKKIQDAAIVIEDIEVEA